MRPTSKNNDDAYDGAGYVGAVHYVDGVDDGVDKCGITDDHLVIHDPYVDEAAVRADGVVWV